MNRASRRSTTLIVALAAIPAAITLAVLYFFAPGTVPGYPICRFYEYTSLACPGCGSLRAIHSLLRGDVVTAFFLNPLLMLSVPALAWLGVRWLKRVRSPEKNHPPLVPAPVVWAAVSMVVVYAILRNLPAFSWMAP